MRLRKNCAAWLGLAGACLFVIGCGGGVPDPGSDANAATGNEPGGGGEAPAPAAAPAVAQAEPPKAQEPATAETPPAQAEAPKEQAKGQGGSTTNEMLALSGGGSSASPAAGSESPAPNASGGAPPAGGAPNRGGMPAGGLPGGGMGAGAGQMGQMAQQSQQNAQQSMADMQKRMQTQMKAQMPAAGGQKQPGPGGADNKVAEGPADVHSPRGAVKTFLDALKAKDGDRLSEATARRAAVEATTKNQEMFSKIIEVSLSDSELEDLAKKLDGYQIAGENPPKSTGRVDVVIQKSGDNGSYSRRRVTARKEKKGWGVLDISPEQVFKSMGGGSAKGVQIELSRL